MNNILIIPHVGISGGAGLYINQVLSELEKKYKVYVGGMFSESYEQEEFPIPYEFNKIILPYYQGISLKACLFYILRSIAILPQAFFCYKYFKKSKDFDIIVLTSGIQILLMPLLWVFFSKSKVLILVQENYRFDRLFLGGISKYFFSKMDVVVSITESWKDYAKSNGVPSILYRNMYKRDLHKKVNRDKTIDFVYVGGDQKIKGYSDLVLFCEKISNVRECSIVILGKVSPESKIKLIKILENSRFKLEIDFLDFVDDVSSIIASSKLLLLPITDAHFCRPAIEAGFEGVPFLIRRHDAIGDFAIEGYNCEMYSDLNEMTNKAIYFLKDEDYTREIGMNNRNISNNFIYDDHIGNAFMKVVEDVLL